MSGDVIRPYGDTTGDGRIQVSFTLPVPFGTATEKARAEGAAMQLATKMGLDPAMVVHAKGMGPDYTFFVVYGRVSHLVDLSKVTVTEREFPLLSPAEVNLRIRTGLGRKLVVVGACIGTDAHTVGIDAILNVKGHSGEKGLEYYREIRVVNLGSQVAVPDLVAKANAEGADAVLVSQVVTQRDAHISNAQEMSAAFDAAALKAECSRPLLVVGGPRFDPSMAGELGVDKIFGKGTAPGEVASYLAYALTPEAADAAAETAAHPAAHPVGAGA
ncbi:MAG TPA: OAM dimerization domain-containing protein [Streptosporangiaceae bacterium]|nr:OAM dimerization domain-containing protein [Streptosporangiaceae bacterium]